MQNLEFNQLKREVEKLEKENKELVTLIESVNDDSKLKQIYQQHKKTVQQQKLREKETSELLLATETILQTDDFTKTAKQIFYSCSKIIGAKAGYVALLSPDGHENELLFLESGGETCTVDTELPMPIRGLREVSYRTGKVVYDNDFMKSKWVKYMPEGHMALPNVLFSPLNIEGKTVGIIGLACKDGDFNEDDAKVAATFGNYAAIALRNSKMIEQLKEANHTKDKFFSIIAHDLKSPFNSLISLSRLLIKQLEEKSHNDVITHANLMHMVMENTLNLLNQLLEWAQIQQDKIKYVPKKLNAKTISNEIIKVSQPEALVKKIQLINEIPTKIQIYADAYMVKTILLNLINNAIKFTHKGGFVRLKAKQVDNKSIKIIISDNGVGIPEETISKLFKIESSVSTEGTNKERGTGLGLILCKEFVQKNKGEIGVTSKVGKGTDFWFTLPAT